MNLKNGNFSISFNDFEQATRYSAFKEIERTYNSKAIEIGPFGYGWGVKFETKLYAYPDGVVLIKENGAGGSTFFKSSMVTQDMLDYMIDKLIDTELQNKRLNYSPDKILKRRNEFEVKSESRYSTWNKYVMEGLLVSFWKCQKGWNGIHLIAEIKD